MHPIMIFILLLLSMPAAQAVSCKIGETIAFTPVTQIETANTAGLSFCIQYGDRSHHVENLIPFAKTEDGEGREIIALRDPVSNFLELQYVSKDGNLQVDLDFRQRSKLHVEHLFYYQDRFFLLAYNVELSIPAGRRYLEYADGLQFFEVQTDAAKPTLTLHENVVFNAGIETPVYSEPVGTDLLVCAGMSCKLLNSSNNPNDLIRATQIKIPDLDGRGSRLIELASNGIEAYGLFTQEFDDRFSEQRDKIYVLCSILPSSTCTELEISSTPYRLKVGQQGASYDTAQTPADYAALLTFDLQRLRGIGVAGFGENNLEGRIAWSSVYYINGLISLASSIRENEPAFAALRDSAATRVYQQLDLISLLLEHEYPGFKVKRYSLDREPLDFLLHHARIARVFFRAQSILGYEVSENVRDFLIANIHPSPHHVEQLDRFGKSQDTSQMVYRKYAPFWADGANVPWNYINGWINGLVQIEQKKLSGSLLPIAAVMLDSFIETEFAGRLPKQWNYSAGRFFHGWVAQDAVSSNTPVYPGDHRNTTKAHISYRTMDAMALLGADRTGLRKLTKQHKEHITSLANSGHLWPLIMEEIFHHDLTFQMEAARAHYYTRMTEPYHLANQVWAIEAILSR